MNANCVKIKDPLICHFFLQKCSYKKMEFIKLNILLKTRNRKTVVLKFYYMEHNFYFYLVFLIIDLMWTYPMKLKTIAIFWFLIKPVFEKLVPNSQTYNGMCFFLLSFFCCVWFCFLTNSTTKAIFYRIKELYSNNRWN